VHGGDGRRFFAAAMATDPDAAELLLTCVGAGLRFQEVAALMVDAITPRGDLDVFRVLRRQPAGSPRAFKIEDDTKSPAGTRIVPVPDALKPILRRRVVDAGDAGLLFPNPVTGRPWHRTRWQARIDRIADAAAAAGIVGRITAHSMRHMFVSVLAEANVDPVTLAAVSGHASVSTSYNTYAHVLGQHASVKKATDRAVRTLQGKRNGAKLRQTTKPRRAS
jgi:integrase